MKKRKTITFDQDLLLVAHALPREERGQFYELLIEHFLDEQEFPATLSPTLKLAICAVSPQIRSLQSKFLNRIDTKATLCPKNEIETHRNASDEIKTHRNASDGMVINKSLFNKQSNNIYKYITTNQVICAHARDASETFNTTAGALNTLFSKNQQAFFNFASAFEHSTSTTKPIKIAGTVKNAEEVALSLINLLTRPAGDQDIIARSEELEATEGVKNPVAYFTTMLWNTYHNKSSQRPAPSKPNFAQRQYSEAELNGLFDDLDSVEV